MQTRLLVIAIFLLLSGVTLYGVYHGNFSPETSGILANLGTGFIGTALTVLVVDWLYERRENARLMPKRIVAQEDVRLLVARIYIFWFQAYMASVPGELPKTIEELVSDDSMNKIRSNLDLNSTPNVTPRMSWWQYLPMVMHDFKSLADRILIRHSETLDPEAYRMVNQLAHDAMDPNISSAIRQSDIELGFPRLQVLGNFITINDEYFPTLLKLLAWCNKEAKEINRWKDNKAKMIDKNLNGSRPDGTPACMISPEELARQLIELEKHQNASKSVADAAS
ncbi:hypothetical protein PSQ20_06285 [Curvibacter sp. RS43]|uniref:hypothetical protein n=1 Tax=Curvibacter microcysteis TaxID=3026419 RepID=UPI00235FEFB4|nr:hypothetical protein [Curvibacter sp. RS43]MDD0809936.1 hypothetical protein [Curvibacter sp. RS43]